MPDQELKQIGIIRAMETVKNKFSDAEFITNIGTSKTCYIHSPSTGIVLSPICTGENPAWRFAALLLSHGDWYIGDKPYNAEKYVPFDSTIKYCVVCGGVGRHIDTFVKTGQDGGGGVQGHNQMCPLG